METLNNTKSIDHFSDKLSKELAQRNIYDVEEVNALIKVSVRQMLSDLIVENIPRIEQEYNNLLVQQSKNRVGTPAYVEMGYKLALLKGKRASARALVRDALSKRDYTRLKKFITDKFGKEIIEQFHREKEKW